jgi:hypothetical protein
MTLVSAVDGQTLAMQDAAAQSAWAGQEQRWIVAHNTAIGVDANPDTPFRRIDTNETKSYTDLGRELAAAGYTGPWNLASVVSVYARTANTQLVPVAQQPAQPAGGRPSGDAVLPSSSQPPAGAQPTGAQPTGAQPVGAQPAGAQTGQNIATGLQSFSQKISEPLHAFGLTLPGYAWGGIVLGAYLLMTSGGTRRRR